MDMFGELVSRPRAVERESCDTLSSPPRGHVVPVALNRSNQIRLNGFHIKHHSSMHSYCSHASMVTMTHILMLC